MSIRDDFNRASLELADLQMSPHEAALKAQAYYRLKKYRAIVDSEGEVVDRRKAERDTARLNAELREYIEHHGPVSAEGQPDLVLKEKRNRWYDLRAMRRDDPQLFEAFLDYLKPDHGMIDGARELYDKTAGMVGLPPLKQWRHEGKSMSLEFERE